ncbi:WXG100 family type VII secretion target [Kitasatospora gansuensis]
MSDFTNFNGYSHGDLRRMVNSMDSGGIMSAADPWRRATDTLKQIRTSLTTASGDATASWEGSTSEAFHTKMTKLAASINNAAAYANDAAVTLELMSAAIDEAKRTMPEEPSFWSKAADAVGDTVASAAARRAKTPRLLSRTRRSLRQWRS